MDHPDDLLARVNLRASLHDARQAFDLSTEAVSRLAGFHYASAVRTLERRTSWEFWLVQQWARGLGQVARLHLDDLDVPAPDPQALVLEMTTAFGGFDEDQLHLRVVAHDLIRTREALGVSRAELASRLGITERAVGCFEQDPLRSWLRTWQRYARGLGGVARPELESVSVEVAS
jgi:DNA-binding XRE family transcriptional regulator